MKTKKLRNNIIKDCITFVTWKCNLVLDVPWFRLFQHQACAIPWDELDLDDSFSSLRNTCTGVQRVALEADFRTNWRTSTLICVCKCHLSFLMLSVYWSLVLVNLHVVVCWTDMTKYLSRKQFGTVVTERVVDTIIVMLITAIAFLMQIGVFVNFFSKTGTRIDDISECFQQQDGL